MEKNDSSNEPVLSHGNPNRKKRLAIILAVIVIVSGLSILAIVTHNRNNTATPSVTNAQQVVSVGSAYSFLLNTKKDFSSVQVYFGDGSSHTFAFNGTTDLNVTHVYNAPGNYFIYYRVNYSGSVYSGANNLIPVEATQTSQPPQESVGLLTLNRASSSSELVNNSYVFSPGSHVSFGIGYYTPPANKTYQVISQEVSIIQNTTVVKNDTYAYSFNSSAGGYILNEGNSFLNVSGLKQGVYSLKVITTTAPMLNSTTGALDKANEYNTTYYVDVAVFQKASVMTQTGGTVLVNAELENGGYSKLDPATVFDTVSYELLMNTYQQLVMFNGSSENTFKPMLATALPTTANGMINNNTKNYTEMTPSGVSYTVHLKPYENYTFYISNNTKWQNGQPVTAWDVMYSLTRTLLFAGGSPTTPAYIQAPLMLPGNYLKTNTFYNITNNMTVDNATNSISFHFQQPESPNLVFQTFDNYGSQVTSANWLQAHGAGITWTPKGFKNYEQQGNAPHYNTYVENHVLSDGPYKIAYVIPGSQIVLVSNPNFVSPGPWFPKAKISKIIIDYVSSPSTISLMLQSNQSQSGQMPTSDWSSVVNMQNQGKVKVLSLVTPAIYWFNFNTNINISFLHKSYTSKANLPFNLFTNHSVRKAFAYSFNYKYYLSHQLGNPAYPNLQVGKRFAGFLEQGMGFSQSISDLNSTTNGNVPYFNLQLAKTYWDQFMSSDAAKVNIAVQNGVTTYNGQTLDIPVFVLKNDFSTPIAISTWQTSLQNVIPGVKLTIVKISFPEWLSLSVNGQNPMTIYPGNWIPSLTTPSSNLGPLAYPSLSLSFQTYMSPGWMGGGNLSNPNNLGYAAQAQHLTDMQSYYNNATASSNQAVREKYFHRMNEELVNMTMDIYLYQSVVNRVVNSHVDSQSITQWNDNPLIAGTGSYFYNYLSYN
ncbi:hypothetical protein IX51_09285 [uncultured archaeon]|nr:hypothetical protein IX51_09285 [uncultured archaeon]